MKTVVSITWLTREVSIVMNYIAVTGPFASSEMAEWFSAGYFTMNLLVKRGCDEHFQALGMCSERKNACEKIVLQSKTYYRF